MVQERLYKRRTIWSGKSGKASLGEWLCWALPSGVEKPGFWPSWSTSHQKVKEHLPSHSKKEREKNKGDLLYYSSSSAGLTQPYSYTWGLLEWLWRTKRINRKQTDVPCIFIKILLNIYIISLKGIVPSWYLNLCSYEVNHFPPSLSTFFPLNVLFSSQPIKVCF